MNRMDRKEFLRVLTAVLFLGQFASSIVAQPIVNSLGIQPTFAVITAAAIAIAYFVGWRRAAASRA